jgi:hypothetical protein
LSQDLGSAGASPSRDVFGFSAIAGSQVRAKKAEQHAAQGNGRSKGYDRNEHPHRKKQLGLHVVEKAHAAGHVPRQPAWNAADVGQQDYSREYPDKCGAAGRHGMPKATAFLLDQGDHG